MTRAMVHTVGIGGILAIVIARCLSPIVPMPFFDVDPAIFGSHRAGPGPAWSLWLDVLLLTCAAIAGLSRAKGESSGWLFFFASVGSIAVAAHLLFGEGVDAWRGSAWATSICGAMVVARSCADPRIRLITIASLSAVLGPLLIKSAAQLGWEHQAMVNALDLLQGEGADLSLSSRQLVARVQEPVIRAWMTTPNLLAAVLVAMAAIWSSLAIVAIRRRLDGGWRALCLAVGLLAAVGVVLTGSKAGILALVMVGGLVVLRSICLQGRVRWGGWLAMALIVAVPVVVLLRGVMDVDALGGERSALVRFHYLVGAAAIWWESAWTGVGIGAFQEAYTQARGITATEEVQSAHNAIVDWITMLGVAGVLWVIVLLNVVRRCGRSLIAQAPPLKDVVVPPWQAVVIITVLGGFVLRFPWLPMGDMLSLAVECVAGTMLVALAVAICRICSGATPAVLQVGLALAAIALAVLGQADMLFFDPATVGWAWMMLAAAAPTFVVCSQYRLEHRIGALAAAIFLAAGCVVAAVEATITTSTMARAAVTIAASPDSSPVLESAGEALAIGGTWTAPRVVGATLLQELPHRHREGTAMLKEIGTLDALHAIVDRSLSGDGERQDLAEAVDAIVEADPNGLRAWWVWSQAMDTLGRTSEARRGWSRVIEIDDAWQYDSLRRLPEASRAAAVDAAGQED